MYKANVPLVGAVYVSWSKENVENCAVLLFLLGVHIVVKKKEAVQNVIVAGYTHFLPKEMTKIKFLGDLLH